MKFPFRILLITIFTLVFSDGFAQSLKYGIVAGLQLSHPKDVDSRLGFNLGMKGELYFSDNESTAYLDFGLLGFNSPPKVGKMNCIMPLKITAP